MPPPARSHLIVGPSGAGKTSLLATLKVAADQPDPDGPRFTLLPRGEATIEYFAQAAAQVMATGRLTFSATLTNQDHAFSLEWRAPALVVPLRGLGTVVRSLLVNGRWRTTGVWGRVRTADRTKAVFQVLDTRGGSVFGGPAATPESGDGSAWATVESARRCDGLVLLADASDPQSAALFWAGLIGFLARTAVDDRVPFRRVAVVLTKADRLVASAGVRALGELRALDPWAHARQLIGDVPLRQLFQYLSPAARREVRCGWASVYGFIPEDGAVNLVAGPDGVDRLAVFRPGALGWVNRWRPFRVLDPFVFVATGDPMGMRGAPVELIGRP